MSKNGAERNCATADPSGREGNALKKKKEIKEII